MTRFGRQYQSYHVMPFHSFIHDIVADDDEDDALQCLVDLYRCICKPQATLPFSCQDAD